LPKAAVAALLTGYSIVLLLLMDFLYSTFLFQAEVLPGIPHPAYHHDLTPNFQSYHRWGEYRYELRTNSLGFKDARVRDIALQKPAGRRVLLIGDSFTEGIGVPFESTFAGLLYEAGQKRTDKVEFLNAGVGSYSPSIYYQKIKVLLNRGLQFDELVVLPDMSDIYDEATTYFCIDDDPQYRAHCRTFPGGTVGMAHFRKCSFLQCSFVVTDSLRVMIKFRVRQWTRSADKNLLNVSPRAGWALPNYKPGKHFALLDIEAGITRAVQNMQKLADLLAQRNIQLTIAVYPWPANLAFEDRNSRQVAIWQQFCTVNRCKAFIDLFPTFFVQKAAHNDWYRRYYIYGDVHFNAGGHRLVYDALARHLF
jgi:hypothetical protein